LRRPRLDRARFLTYAPNFEKTDFSALFNAFARNLPSSKNPAFAILKLMPIFALATGYTT
jgi:hypothetical protein